MKQKRFLWHILFWLAQYSLSLYNELYLSASFTKEPSLEIFLQAALAVFVLLVVKMGATYFTLYGLIPKWLAAPSKLKPYALAILTIFVASLIMRLCMHYLIWPLIFEEPERPLVFAQLVARYFYSMLDLLQVVGLASAIKLFKIRILAIKNEKLLVQEKLRSELLHLKAQVNPHFLFNTINSIYSLARSQSLLTPDAVMRLSKILRYMLYDTSEKTISLKQELQVLDDYIELQQLRFSKRIEVKVFKTIDNDLTQLTPLLLLPLVENAFKHGSNEGGLIEITISLKNKQLVFEVKNPFNEITFETKEEEGIGLENIKRQLALLYAQSSLKTVSQNKTFTVTLQIDLETYAGTELFNS